MPQLWWDRPADRLLVVSGWLDDRFLGQAGHFVGDAWSGVVLCPRSGRWWLGMWRGRRERSCAGCRSWRNSGTFFCRRKALRASGKVRSFCPRVPPAGCGRWGGAALTWRLARWPLIGRPTAPRCVPLWMECVPVRCCTPSVHVVLAHPFWYVRNVSRTGRHDHNGGYPAGRCTHDGLLNWSCGGATTVVRPLSLGYLSLCCPEPRGGLAFALHVRSAVYFFYGGSPTLFHARG